MSSYVEVFNQVLENVTRFSAIVDAEMFLRAKDRSKFGEVAVNFIQDLLLAFGHIYLQSH